MKIEIEKTFPMPGSADLTWHFLQDIAAVAECMPGAKITDHLADGTYKGTVTVRLGPVSMAFRGDVSVKEVDSSNRTLHLQGKGTDKTGTSGASMDLHAYIEANELGLCNLVGKSVVSMSGKAASFGGRLMNTVADQILIQFADNFATHVAALQAQVATGDKNAVTSTGVTEAPVRPVTRELNAFALLWSILKTWLRTLFTRKASKPK